MVKAVTKLKYLNSYTRHGHKH